MNASTMTQNTLVSAVLEACDTIRSRTLTRSDNADRRVPIGHETPEGAHVPFSCVYVEVGAQITDVAQVSLRLEVAREPDRFGRDRDGLAWFALLDEAGGMDEADEG